jgi:hypothetical protein
MGLELPMILLRDEELGGMVDTYSQFKRVKEHAFGESWHHRDTGNDFDVIYLNVEASDYLAQIIDTVVHELVHLKYPNARHGMGFQKKINTIIMESN